MKCTVCGKEMSLTQYMATKDYSNTEPVKTEDNQLKCPRCGRIMEQNNIDSNNSEIIELFEEQKDELKKGCSTVSYTWLGICIFASIILLINILLYISGNLLGIEFGFYCVSNIIIICISSVMFAKYKKYKKWVDAETLRFINHFKNYSFVIYLIASILLCLLAIIPVVLTNILISNKLKDMLNEENKL